MKKNIFLTLALVGTLGLVSCKKEKPAEPIDAEYTTIDTLGDSDTSEEVPMVVENNDNILKFVGDGKELIATYQPGETESKVILSYDGKTETLLQTTAWAKGAEYENEAKTIKFTSKRDAEKQEDIAELTEGGKTYNLKAVK